MCVPSHLLSSKGAVGCDHLAHEHGGRDHDGSARHGSRHQLGDQLLPRREPGQRDGGTDKQRRASEDARREKRREGRNVSEE